MRVAFYAPLKPPDHRVPSGDRRIAQLLWQALQQAGHEPVLASRFRSRDASGARMTRLAETGARLAERCRRRLGEAKPDAWLTYHLYYKAPDWIGPHVARALGIPYLVAEASLAPKRVGGPWDSGHRAVVEALRQARAVLALSRLDMECLAPAVPDARLIHFPPFLDAAPFAMPRWTRDAPTLLAVGMMRPGAKLASYRLLAEALARLADRPWQLQVAGDGPARADVEALLAPLGARAKMLGAVAPAEMPSVYASADLLVWPAVDEAFGMALLEAQAAGTPVVAGGYGGVPEIVADGRTGLVAPPGDAEAFSAAVAGLLGDRRRLLAMGDAARAHVAAHHALPAAARRLDDILQASVRS
jgi:glycosyltransferase involved in cell wall biosynthesis